jgi:hypothetical protein
VPWYKSIISRKRLSSGNDYLPETIIFRKRLSSGNDYLPETFNRKPANPRQTESNMPQMSSVIVVPICGHLPHDTEGKLLRMGNDATGKVVAAHSLSRSSPLRKKLYEEAMCIRIEEKKGWLAVSTDEFPAGDLEGAAQASLAIACYYLELDNLEKGHTWLQKAQDEAPKNKILLCAFIEHNMDVVKKVLQQCSASSTPAQSGRSSPVAPVPASQARPLDAASLASDLEILTSDLEILSI